MEYLKRNNKSTLGWTEKYCPKKINEVIGNNKIINEILTWIRLFEEKYKDNQKKRKLSKKSGKKVKLKMNKSSMLITGNHGVGKTCIAHAILNTLGYVVQVLNLSKIKNNKSIKNVIDKRGDNRDYPDYV